MASTSIEDALGSKLKAPLAPHVEWSFTGTDSKAQSLATTVSDDCSKAACVLTFISIRQTFMNNNLNYTNIFHLHSFSQLLPAL